MSKIAENAQLPIHTLPPRVSLEDILKNQIAKFIVLPVPPHSKPWEFENIGRTSFKKYVIGLYQQFFSLEDDLWQIPFLLSSEARNPHIIQRPIISTNNTRENQIAAEMNIKSELRHEAMMPSHGKFLLQFLV